MGIPFGFNILDAGLSIQLVTGQVFRPVSPYEIHTEAQPPLCALQQMPVEEISKEDVANGKIKLDFEDLLGVYRPVTREILIYRRAINHLSKPLDVDARDIEQIVRIHEHCHALIHLGVFLGGDREDLDMMPVTDWGPFLAKRYSFFAAVDIETQEFLAQILTWSVIKSHILQNSLTLEQIFIILMQKQTPIYQIDPSLYQQITSYLPRMLQLLWLYRRENGLSELRKSECSGRVIPCRQVVKAYLRT